MSKGITQSQWLNIVIMVISGLILAFMLLGRFMNRAVDEFDDRESGAKIISSQLINQQLLQLNRIDFGTLRMTLDQPRQSLQPISKWSVAPMNSLSAKEIEQLVNRWQQILAIPTSRLYLDEATDYNPVATVLLYFAETTNPLVAKVEIESVLDGNTSRKPIIYITFVSTGQQVVFKDLSLSQLIPVWVSQPTGSENRPSDNPLSDGQS